MFKLNKLTKSARLGGAVRRWTMLAGLSAASLLYITHNILKSHNFLQFSHSSVDLLWLQWRSGQALGGLLLSGLFQFFLLVLGWIAFFRLRQREIGQLRLRRSEQKYRSIINHASEAIFLLDADGKIMEWNKAAERIFGIPRRNALTRMVGDLDLGIYPPLNKILVDAKRMKKSASSEFQLTRESGFAQLSVVVSTIEQGKGAKAEQAGAYVVFVRDITSEKQIETRMSETEKMAGIGQLAAGIAHQLNTPLGSILLSAQMLEEDIDDTGAVEDIRRIIRQTEQCRRIIKGLLNFARPTGRERGKLNLVEAIGETVYLMEKTLKVRNVEVEILEETAPWVHGNRNELEQVFFNMLANALDAMPRGGRITIRVLGAVPGEIKVEFRDEGEGIAAEHRDRVFLPFFTTKDYGKGTGLGLSIVARIIHEHGGHVEMTSEPGRGTTFTLTLPAARVDTAAEDLIF